MIFFPRTNSTYGLKTTYLKQNCQNYSLNVFFLSSGDDSHSNHDADLSSGLPISLGISSRLWFFVV